MKLSELKSNYEKLMKEYKLPPFKEMNENFEIEKLQDNETEMLPRNIRRLMTEKIAVILRFLEVLVNPTENPGQIYIFSVIKSITPEAKKIIERVYKELVSIELTCLTLDIEYDEKKEIKFILEMAKKWPSLKKDLKEITNKIGVVWEHERKSHAGYFG